MNLWQVHTDATHVVFGSSRRGKLQPRGCNQPYRGRFWCPGRGWFTDAPCPFRNRRECDCFKKLCGRI